MGLAEVIFTSPLPEPVEGNGSGQVAGHAYLHLPGVVATEAASGTRRYLLSDGLGSVRQVTDEAGEVVSTHEFDPYGVPLTEPAGDPYGYTGEWWQADIGLLHLRARWYDPGSGTFLSRDAVESEPPYLYVGGNVINRVDPSGNQDESICNQWSGELKQTCLELFEGPPPIPWKQPPQLPPPPPPPGTPTIGPTINLCYSILPFKAKGYVEGKAMSGVFGLRIIAVNGEEVVYDFATLERGVYNFEGESLLGVKVLGVDVSGNGYSTALVEGAVMLYDVQLDGFKNDSNLDAQYKGRFIGLTVGAGLTPGVTGGFGKIFVNPGAPISIDSDLTGIGDYTVTSVGIGLDELGVLSGSIGATNYKHVSITRYIIPGMNARKQDIEQIKADIMSGVDSPWGLAWTAYTRVKAVKELDEIWEKNRFYFENEFGHTQLIHNP